MSFRNNYKAGCIHGMGKVRNVDTVMHSRTQSLLVSIAECAERLCGRGELGHVMFIKSLVQVKLLALRKNVGHDF